MERLQVYDVRKITASNGAKGIVTLMEERQADEAQFVTAQVTAINRDCENYKMITLVVPSHVKTGLVQQKDFEKLQLAIGHEVRLTILKTLDDESLRNARERLNPSWGNQKGVR